MAVTRLLQAILNTAQSNPYSGPVSGLLVERVPDWGYRRFLIS
jgi:hypothetical protein